jgi:release factor glutamine methyltransferase
MSSHLRKDGSPDQAEPTLKDLVDTYVNRLQRAGVYSPEGDVRKIVAFVFGEPSPSLTRHVSADLRNKMDWLIQQREARRPLARIFGFAEFYGLPIKTHDGVFQPYPETEILVDVATDYFRDRRAPLRILDVGSGSGCVLLALLNEYPRATGVGVDRDMPAVAAGKENARHLGFADQASFVIGDWTEGVREQFDLIVCNPPRVPTPMVSRLLPEMRDFDPLPTLGRGFRHPGQARRRGNISSLRCACRCGYHAVPWPRRRAHAQQLSGHSGSGLRHQAEIGSAYEAVFTRKW